MLLANKKKFKNAPHHLQKKHISKLGCIFRAVHLLRVFVHTINYSIVCICLYLGDFCNQEWAFWNKFDEQPSWSLASLHEISLYNHV